MKYLSNSYKLLTTKLSGSTILETIVASLIFMILFSMTMDVLTRILISNSKDNENLFIESAFHQCEREIKKKSLVVGNETYKFGWGEIQVNVSQYQNDLLEVVMSATTNENKKVNYRYITVNENIKE